MIRSMHADTVRTFIALFLPDDVLDAVAARVRQAGAGIRDVSWTKRDNLHLTLRFLGDVERGRLEDVARAAHTAARDARPLTLHLALPGAFPHLRAPRVLWLGLAGDVTPLRELAGRVDAEVDRAGLGAADKPFAPHLTIGRVRTPDPRADWAQRLASLRVEASAFTLREVCVVQSVLHPRGSIYTVLARAPLEDA